MSAFGKIVDERLVGGRYRVLAPLGNGGMATVYLAEAIDSGRRVALKLLTFADNDDRAAARFQREIDATRMLSHPNIVAMYDAGFDDHACYMAMEYLPRGDLKALLRAGAPLPEREALRLTGLIAKALDYAHRLGVVHRDVKPQNILLDGSGDPKLADFGIALLRDAGGLTETNAILGSAHYLSPEQAQGRLIDFRTDIYSLGVVLYEMLTGRVPFDGDNAVAIASRHATAAPPPPGAINPAISGAAEAIVLRSMAKDPEERYQSAAELSTALAQALSTGTVETSASPTVRIANGPATPSVRRVRAPSALPDYAPSVASTPAPAARHNRESALAPGQPAALSNGHHYVKLAAGLLALLTLLSVAALSMAARRPAATVAVPDLVGLSRTEAQLRADEAGLGLEIAGTEERAGLAADVVLVQQPEAAAQVPSGSLVSIVLSVAARPSTVDSSGDGPATAPDQGASPPPTAAVPPAARAPAANVAPPPQNRPNNQPPGRGNEKKDNPGRGNEKKTPPGHNRD